MTNDLSRNQERRGTARIASWAVVVIALVFLGLLAFFIFAPLSNASRQPTPQVAPEQNEGGNAPAPASPAAG
ncbi:hypothetical protein LB524_16435 [Mesorhizobium sp. ESP6-5]|uniref:hypothetical protein n=1 Tax=unclassified Mesorhizobium TaxID=325217 RepID=UPI00114DA41A|nr:MULTISPECIES: hypothetical protein [unclassified Mesorhizobium]MBZ9756881.1 hypothetical protein [Mesorhizobium sp. ESP6-5]TPK79976.1 hypothetical protein FJ936_29295 [Mesorhizobium sp. B2-4-13]